jgi:hypothetical protein
MYPRINTKSQDGWDGARWQLCLWTPKKEPVHPYSSTRNDAIVPSLNDIGYVVWEAKGNGIHVYYPKAGEQGMRIGT